MKQLFDNINYLSDKLTDLHFYFISVPNIGYCKQAEEVINTGHELTNILYKYGDNFNSMTVDLSTLSIINLISMLEFQRITIEDEEYQSLMSDKQKEELLFNLSKQLKQVIQEVIKLESLDELDL